MSTDEYVPSEARDVAEVEFRVAYRFLHAELLMDPDSKPYGPAEQAVADAEFDLFLARVRRDAAREALDGLAENMRRISFAADEPLLRIQAAFAADIAAEYKTNAYPETEDQT